MVTFRNNNSNSNNRRPPFRSNNNRRPPFRRNDEGSNFSNNDNFQRKTPGRNNQNPSKLIEKYNDLAREALVNEDKILSENYFQYADHFTRVQNERESSRIPKFNNNSTNVTTSIKPEKVQEEEKLQEEEKDTTKELNQKKTEKLVEKKTVIKPLEKKTVTS